MGKHFEFRVLDTFAQYWVSLFSHSAAARLAWKARTGTAMRTYNPTRWWSKWEVMNLVLTDVEPFVRDNDHLAPATRAHQMEIFNSPGDSKDLELELAAFVDGGNHFVSATYYLEGDRLLVFSCYERLATVSNENVCAFCSARLCCPVQVQQLHSTAASVEELRRFRFLDNDAIIQGLTAELPRYLAVADGADLQTEEEKLQWWSRNEANLPNWSFSGLRHALSAFKPA